MSRKDLHKAGGNADGILTESGCSEYEHLKFYSFKKSNTEIRISQ